MTQMLMPVGGVGTVSVALQQSALTGESRTGQRGNSWCQSHKLLALTNANSVLAKYTNSFGPQLAF